MRLNNNRRNKDNEIHQLEDQSIRFGSRSCSTDDHRRVYSLRQTDILQRSCP